MFTNKNRSFALIFITLISVGSGCSKSDPTPSNDNSMPAQNLADAQQLANAAKVHCSDPSQCSPSVGMLIGTTATSAFQCTAFLIASNIVATNSHCIPDDLKAAGSNCQDRIALAFPAYSQYQDVKTGCSQVLTASPIDTTFKNPDYAFVKLDVQVNRPLLAISHEGLADNSIYNLIKIDPYQGNGIPEGYMHEAQCKAVYNSVINANSNFPQAPVMTIADCAVLHGNSGSPLTDSSGKVPAIAFATLDQATIDTAIAERGMEFINSQSAAQLGLATSYACLQLPGEASASAAAACAGGYTGTDNSNQDLQKTVSDDLQARFNKIEAQLDPSVSWDVGSESGKGIDQIGLVTDDATSLVAFPYPKCVKNLKNFLSSYKNNGGNSEGDKVDVTRSLPVWSIQLGFNSYLQLDYQITEAPTSLEEAMTLEFDSAALRSSGQTSISEGDAMDLYLSKPFYQGELSGCAPAVKP